MRAGLGFLRNDSAIMRVLAGVSLAALVAGCSDLSSEIAPRAAAQTPAAACSPSPESGGVEAVVAAATAFSKTLTAPQRALLGKPMTFQTAIRWSNFPARMVARNGVAFGDMNPEQTQAGRALIQAAAGACGARLFLENQASDAFGPQLHYINFNGEPSVTAPWGLMIGGHHLAYNFTFNAKEAGATPLFAGSDPAKYTDAAGVEHEAMAQQSAALSALAVAATKYPDAHLPGVFTDLVKSVVSIGDPLGVLNPQAPTGGDPAARQAAERGNRSPNFGVDARQHTFLTGTTGRGVRYTQLTPSEQALVRRAIESYAVLSGRKISAPLVQHYMQPDALAQTYVVVSGDPKLIERNGYIRIDGPRVWIELSVQTSLVNKELTHYHSLWRDKVSDYGGLFKT